MAEGLKKERLVCERDGAINRVRVLESEVGDARRRIGERDEKCVFDFPIACFLFCPRWVELMTISVRRLHQADTQYQVRSAQLRVGRVCAHVYSV